MAIILHTFEAYVENMPCILKQRVVAMGCTSDMGDGLRPLVV